MRGILLFFVGLMLWSCQPSDDYYQTYSSILSENLALINYRIDFDIYTGFYTDENGINYWKGGDLNFGRVEYREYEDSISSLTITLDDLFSVNYPAAQFFLSVDSTYSLEDSLLAVDVNEPVTIFDDFILDTQRYFLIYEDGDVVFNGVFE